MPRGSGKYLSRKIRPGRGTRTCHVEDTTKVSRVAFEKVAGDRQDSISDIECRGRIADLVVDHIDMVEAFGKLQHGFQEIPAEGT